ncbi:hypothetical protein ACFOLL_04360 [Falsochrobactrum ovis]|uniref:Uncharacterized protein n=1 Tax=Falsochrobactrum ovis TaxID=1293442 RepID=A0A364JW19_9HYPH|nr:hypothetical protein [Falsochrobactrum ovis]RAK29157.1 hypothetical protein C7374_105208 [Falsochrobactrum ovis]
MTTKSNADVMFVGLLALAFFLCGLGVLGFQIFEYLKTGIWSGFSLLNLLSLFVDDPWIYYPQSWFGVHKILAFIPSSATMFVIGYFILVSN